MTRCEFKTGPALEIAQHVSVVKNLTVVIVVIKERFGKTDNLNSTPRVNCKHIKT